MKNRFFGFLFLFLAFASTAQSPQKDFHSLDQLIDNWHLAATQANFETYFALTSSNFVFLGTAPGERWTKSEFMSFCKPYFDKGKAWDFKPSHRNWQFAADGTVAYFDEDLATWMEGCRGSGICVLENGEWKIAYYNLTVLIENEKIKSFIKLRKQ
ncbi:MAG: hypothetical protein RL331_1096 [Bacteroidota bacterium]|jgi:hypothetical protein